jgi:DNA-binding NarL/FixJ family response regulator
MPKSRPNAAVIHIAVIDGDPLRSVGFRACLGSELDFEIQAASLIEISAIQGIDLVVLGPVGGTSMDVLSSLRTLRPDLKVIVTGCNLEDDVILRALAGGAKGCVDETTPVNELARAIRVVHAGSVWASRRILSLFVDRVQRSSGAGLLAGERCFTSREKQVLRMLVTGCSNREIAAPLCIEERTVKAHVAKLMRKVGVPNRIMLSVHAIKHSLVSA